VRAGNQSDQAARPISIAKLSALLRVHLRPIKQVVFLRPSGI